MSDALAFTWGDGWVPAELVWFRGRPAVSLVRLPDDRLAEPFFRQTLRRAAAAKERPRLLLLDEAVQALDRFEPSGFLFHMLRCGSTLASRLLGAIPGTRALSEPPLFHGLLSKPGVAEADRRRWLRRLLGLYARGLCGADDLLVVKWSSAVGRFIGLIEEVYPGVPKVFLTRDPVEVLVSIAEARPAVCRDATEGQLAPHLCVGGGAAMERDARYVASCCYWASESRRLRLLDYAGLPAAVWNRVAGLFGLRCEADDVRRLQALAGFYSKAVEPKVFEADAASKRARAAPEVREAAARIVVPELARLRACHPAL